MKVVNRSNNFFSVDSEGTKRYMTDWICDAEQTVTDINADSGSIFFSYPSGSSILCLENGKVYVLNESQTEFAEIGNYTPPTPEEPSEDDENEGE